MKKLSISMLLISMFILLGCNNNSAQNKDKESETTITNKFDNQGKVVTLNKLSFIDLVMDFEKNPNTWIFKGEKPCVIDFYADWCRPCKMVAPIMEELAAEYNGQINIYKVNVDNEKELSALFKIESIPAILFCPKEGQPALQPGAMSKEQYKEIFESYVLKKTADSTKTKN